jgi:hypothetical protein
VNPGVVGANGESEAGALAAAACKRPLLPLTKQEIGAPSHLDDLSYDRRTRAPPGRTST